ncbi:unnamed protein product [Clonostachys rosea]|uniref:PH domain-containing protein n=1 Tax=Bionectria ochroleuca TaxID=29856 RepID=A0ABY6V4N0_BIOOC|nr:unnamed protein product [Clonostachys rosea]
MATSPPSSTLPSRAATGLSAYSEDNAYDYDTTSTAGLLAERLQAWKHAVGYLEEYIGVMEKLHGKHAKEYERALKTISNPLREGHHFDQSLGGLAGFFENLRANTQSLINTNMETEKAIKSQVLPVLDRLHKEIKAKSKELANGAIKGAKEVEKLRGLTQKQIEFLGQQTAAYDAVSGKLNSIDDPYVLRRGVLYRLTAQCAAENNHHNDLVVVQHNFATFEARIISIIQQAMEQFTTICGGQADKTRALHTDMLNAIQHVPAEFEWANFTVRYAERLAQPNEPPRSIDQISFPGQAHESTVAVKEGSLERRSRNKLSWGYTTNYYVITPSRFLHQFKDSEMIKDEPKPELSLYLPDAVVGLPAGDKFTIKGKDRSRTVSSKLTGTAEINFKAASADDAQKWVQVISNLIVAPEKESPVATAGAATPTSAKSGSPKAQKEAITPPPASTPVDSHQAQEAGVTEAPAASAKPAVAADSKPATADSKPSADTKTPVAEKAVDTKSELQ